jgi:branched-chain amino acid aminotransferase
MKRAFVYGDLIFETIKAQAGMPLLAHAHYARLMNSATALLMETTLTFETFVQAIQDALSASGMQDARVRFVLYRDANGFYHPDKHTTAWEVEVFPLPLKKSNIHLGLYSEAYKPTHAFSLLKSGNAQLYVMASIWARQHGFDDALLLNEHGFICEATSSNVFVVKGEEVSTPHLAEGCIDGIMRMHVMQQLKAADYTMQERPVSIQEVEQADAVFLTNALHGIVPVASFEKVTYDLSAIQAMGLE